MRKLTIFSIIILFLTALFTGYTTLIVDEPPIRFALLGLTVAIAFFTISYLSFEYDMGIVMKFNYLDKIGRMVEYKKLIAEVNTEDGRNNLEYVLPQCRYALEALLVIEVSINDQKLKKDLIDKAVDIINTAIIKDTCKNNKKEICKIIEICLKFAPNNEELEKIKKEYFSIYCTVS
jgi:hypothetical protein